MTRRSQQHIIAGLMDRLDPMVESPTLAGMSSMMAGGSAGTRGDSTLDNGVEDEATVLLAEPCDNGDCDEDDDGSFNEFQLRVAKRFIELMGSADKARAVIDKVDECEECLGLIDDDDIRDDHDASMIQKISSMLPGLPDLPMELSNLYNPSANNQSM